VIGHETIDGRPTGSCSAGGCNKVSNAGKTVIAAKNAMNIPVPTMRPNSETPR
jgi:hypothetical protein